MIQHLLNAAAGLGNLLDTPGSVVRDALAGQNPFDQLLNPFSSANRFSGRDLLRHHGLIGHEDNWGNFAGGLGAELATDPLNVIPGVMMARRALAARTANQANVGIRASNATSMGQRAMGFFPEESIAHLHPSLVENGVPKKFYHGTVTAFEHFDPLKDSGENLYGRGFYHTSNPEIGSTYAKGGREMTLEEMADHFKPGKNIVTGGRRQMYVHKYEPPIAPGENPLVTFERYNRNTGLPEGRIEQQRLLPPLVPGEHNVRMAYLDVRNPFNVDTAHHLNELPTPAGAKVPLNEYAEIANRSAREEIRRRLSILRGDAKAVYSPEAFQQSKSEVLNNFANRHSKTMRGDKYLWYVGNYAESDVQDALKGAGYDGITHIGGGIMGDVAHNVAIAFEPSQVYKPYIAKAIQTEKPVPTVLPKRTALGLAAYNTASRSRGQR